MILCYFNNHFIFYAYLILLSFFKDILFNFCSILSIFYGILGFNTSSKSKPKISKLFVENTRGAKNEKNSKKRDNNPIMEEDLQGQGIQVAPFEKKKSMKRTRISLIFYIFWMSHLKNL